MRYIVGLTLSWLFLSATIQAQNIRSLIPESSPTTQSTTNIKNSNIINNLNTETPTNNAQVKRAEPTVIDKDILQSAPLVNIEVIGSGFPSFKLLIPPPPPPTILERAAKIRQEAIYQRKRFDETLQPIEMESDRLFYRRDAYGYTKGIILFKFLQDKMDLGIYRQNFSPASTPLSGSILPDYTTPESNGVVFRNGSRLFFGLRMRLPMTR